MGLEGLSAAKQAMIALVVFSLVVGLALFVITDAASDPLINKTAPSDLNNTFNKVAEIQNITNQTSSILLNQETSDLNALSSMLAAGSSVIRLFKNLIGMPLAMAQDVAVIFGLDASAGGLLLAAISAIVIIIVLFMILRAIFSAGGGS